MGCLKNTAIEVPEDGGFGMCFSPPKPSNSFFTTVLVTDCLVDRFSQPPHRATAMSPGIRSTASRRKSGSSVGRNKSRDKNKIKTILLCRCRCR